MAITDKVIRMQSSPNAFRVQANSRNVHFLINRVSTLGVPTVTLDAGNLQEETRAAGIPANLYGESLSNG